MTRSRGALVKGITLNRLLLITCATFLVASNGVGCIHADITRMGRMPLGGGQEGLAPILNVLSPDQEKAALISVNSSRFGNSER